MTAARRPRDCRQRGETLVELVLAIFIMGSAGLVFLGALAAAWINADRQNGQERARSLAATVQELATADNPRFIACEPAQAAYQAALDEIDVGEDYTLTVTEVAGWNGTTFSTAGACDPATQRLQRVTVAATGPSGAAQQVVFAKSRARLDGSEALVDAATTPAALGTFTLRVASPPNTPNPDGTVRFAVFAPADVECTNPLWQTLADPADPAADPAAKAAVAPGAALPRTADIDFSDKQAQVEAPLFTIAESYGNSPGTYRWRATYLGGAAADPTSTPCGGPGREIPLERAAIQLEPRTVGPGEPAVYRTGLRLGNVAPGQVKVTVHGVTPGAAPGDPCAAGTPRELPPITPAPDGALTVTVPPSVYEDYGDYVVTADYLGDVGHLPTRQECAQGAPLRVRAASEIGLAVISTPQGPGLDAAVTDGWTSPASPNPGVLTFKIFHTRCMGAPVAEQSVPLTNGRATATFPGLASGEYWALAEWAGDERNVGDATTCQPFPVAGAAPPADPMVPPGANPANPPGAVLPPGPVAPAMRRL